MMESLQMRKEGDHFQVSENVFNNLPSWQRELWKDVRDAFIGPYSGYVDYLAPHADPEKCLKIEPRYKELMYIDGQYCEVALRSAARPGQKAASWPFVRDVGGRPLDYVFEPEPFAKVFGHYFDLAVRSLQAGDHATAAKAAGIVSHIFCDNQPGDHIEPALWVGLILPPPDELRTKLSDCNGLTTQDVQIPRVLYKPQLLGTTAAEAMFRFYHRHLDMMKRSIPQITKMLQAVYRGEPEEAQRILSHNRLQGIEVISDFIYTAFCIAFNRFDGAELAAAAALDLTRIYPMVNQMDYLYLYGPYTDAVIDNLTSGKYTKIPPELLVIQNGKTELKVPRPVLGVLPDSGAQWPEKIARLVYELPVDGSGRSVYNKFTSLAGLSPKLSVNASNGLKGKVAVKVLGDGKTLFEKTPVNGGEPAFEIDVPLEGVRQLELLVTGLHRTTDDFWLGHFIWGCPTVRK
jgi:hypothetical protein